jgi:AcrR family transcriptional regulator
LLRSYTQAVEPKPTTPRGRQAEAARNDHLILDAARSVFLTDPTAPLSLVAARAGVGIAALYRRYASKEELLGTVCAEGLARYIHETELALSDESEPWTTFVTWMGRVVDADTNSLVQRLAGSFVPTDQMFRDGDRARQLTKRLVERIKRAGALRRDVDANDVAQIFEMIASVRLGDRERTVKLRRRYLALLLAGLHPPAAVKLPESAPTWEEHNQRWIP